MSEHDPRRLAALLRPALSHLDHYRGLPDIEVAADAIAQAVVRGEPLALLSDFDADGASSHGVVRLALEQCFGHPASRITGWIGHRRRDGYGVSDTLTDRLIAQLEPGTLAVTMDQGTADHPRLERLAAAGVRTVVTDHHGVPDAGPPAAALACVNPVRADTGTYPDPHIAGVAVAWLTCCAVRQRLIDLGHLPGTAPSLAGLLDLVAVGVAADAVDLAHSVNNRAFIQAGLRLMNSARPRPCIQAVRELRQLTRPFEAADLSWVLGPLVNSAGRVDDAMLSVRFLLAPDLDQARAFLDQLEQANIERKQIDLGMREAALTAAMQAVDAGAAGLILHLPDGHSGIGGIACSRVTETTGRPAGVFCPKLGEEGIVTGSFRSIPQVSILAALQFIRQRAPALLIAGGGHHGAGGATLRAGDLPTLARLFDEAVREQVDVQSLVPRILTDGSLDCHLDLGLLQEIAAIGPWGRGFEPPRFSVEARIDQVRAVGDGSHLKLVVHTHRGQRVPAIWFSAVRPGLAPPVEVGDHVRLVAQLDANTWKGNTTLQLLVSGAERA